MILSLKFLFSPPMRNASPPPFSLQQCHRNGLEARRHLSRAKLGPGQYIEKAADARSRSRVAGEPIRAKRAASRVRLLAGQRKKCGRDKRGRTMRVKEIIRRLPTA